MKTLQDIAREHAEVELHFANGGSVDVSPCGRESWMLACEPLWDWSKYDYRKAAQPIIPKPDVSHIRFNGKRVEIASEQPVDLRSVDGSALFLGAGGGVCFPVSRGCDDTASNPQFAPQPHHRWLLRVVEPKIEYVPWTLDTLPPLPFEVRDTNGDRHTIVAANTESVRIASLATVWVIMTYGQLIKSGITYNGKPCGQEVRK